MGTGQHLVATGAPRTALAWVIETEHCTGKRLCEAGLADAPRTDEQINRGQLTLRQHPAKVSVHLRMADDLFQQAADLATSRCCGR